ncbi:MAG: phage polymerase-related protein [Caulobacteraceae bacterium]|nr:phage polymerase-related protein [Caulobacteraceae bacterium]
MRVAQLSSETDFDGWRRAARRLRLEGVPPDQALWRVGAGDLFALAEGEMGACAHAAGAFTVPPAFPALAADVVCHRSADRFSRLYNVLWRLKDEPRLLEDRADPDVADALRMAGEVRRASHKMKAFVRFRLLEGVAPETYVAWFEPPHHVLERTAQHFVKRFANLRFSILTPDLCCHWDGAELAFTPGARKEDAPAADPLERDWLTYYASIFNPARLKVAAMQSEMPKRYWRNLPEAALIPALIEAAQERAENMVASEPTQPRKRAPSRTTVALIEAAPSPGDAPGSLEEIAAGVQACRRCDLWRGATQGVPGEGPAHAPLMLVGEQPGDMEDVAGHPFVGPAGQLLDRALAEAGIDRGKVFVTNAVKHFKHELRGKRRLHKTPDAGEITACRWWLDNERRLVRPRVIVALGGSAALAVFGRAMPIMKSRGQAMPLEDGAKGVVTVHPSYLLRVPDAAAKAAAYRDFVRDLTAVAELLRFK